MDTGKKQRMSILEKQFRVKIEPILKHHSWKTEVEKNVEDGEYLIIKIERASIVKRFGYLYSCATKNEVYKKLDSEVDLIVLNDQYYHLESYAYGISTEVIESRSFFEKLKMWNAETDSDALISETLFKRDTCSVEFPTRIESESPIEQIWQYLKLFSNKAMAKGIIVERHSDACDIPEEMMNVKAEGLAFCMQNAYDYFQVRKEQKLSQRIVNLYYGMVSFASAEIIASKDGPIGLDEIENYTKYGHGLYTFDGEGGNPFESLKVGVLSNGFFKEWMNTLGKSTQKYPTRKPKQQQELDRLYSCGIIELFARIPELEFVFGQVTNEKFRCVEVIHDFSGNTFGSSNVNNGGYLLLYDATGGSTPEDIRNLPYNFKEIQYAESERRGVQYRVRFDTCEGKSWYQELPLHKSPFVRHRMIYPIFEDVFEFRAIATSLLYALSIIVRYRPSIWRGILSGDNEKYLVMIEQFLDVVERVIPEDFLSRISGKKISVKMAGSMYM